VLRLLSPLSPSLPARFKEYQAAKAAGQLLLTTDDAVKAAARVLAAKIKAKEEVGIGGASGDDEDGDGAGGAGTKRGRASRQRGGSRRTEDAEAVGGNDDRAADDDLAPDEDLLAELKGELEDEDGSGDDRGGGGGGAHAPCGLSLFASQDVQIGNHGAYVAREDYEGQVGRAEGGLGAHRARSPLLPLPPPPHR
jgi:hypothetical protein